MGRKTNLRKSMESARFRREDYLTKTVALRDEFIEWSGLPSVERDHAILVLLNASVKALTDQLVEHDLIDRARYNHDRYASALETVHRS